MDFIRALCCHAGSCPRYLVQAPEVEYMDLGLGINSPHRTQLYMKTRADPVNRGPRIIFCGIPHEYLSDIRLIGAYISCESVYGHYQRVPEVARTQVDLESHDIERPSLAIGFVGAQFVPTDITLINSARILKIRSMTSFL